LEQLPKRFDIQGFYETPGKNVSLEAGRQRFGDCRGKTGPDASDIAQGRAVIDAEDQRAYRVAPRG